MDFDVAELNHCFGDTINVKLQMIMGNISSFDSFNVSQYTNHNIRKSEYATYSNFLHLVLFVTCSILTMEQHNYYVARLLNMRPCETKIYVYAFNESLLSFSQTTNIF